ncbi:aminoglycoside phosphotransferase family protein [Candidatus Dojkabacteria bacterium]|uniref:Aminoglycoside phosphotransferase family protein n=1 Tax=Candidatus Dojkabacteria bacterium TaxID=2099670 RepID=A0A955L7N7_9BACT|nr:aminoglycoside phosphotransferase family protein [Candidatus Dojkabacteria bacterium]
MSAQPPQVILKALKLENPKYLGNGQESFVYKIDTQRILRVFGGTNLNKEKIRFDFYKKLKKYEVSFLIPEIYEYGEIEGHVYSIEKLLPGKTIEKEFISLNKKQKEKLFRSYLQICSELEKITIEDLSYGDIMREPRNCNGDSWHKFLQNRIEQAIEEGEDSYKEDVPNIGEVYKKFQSELHHLPEFPEKTLIHGDLFFENIMVNDNLDVTAVFDFSALSVIGDWQLDVANVFNYMSYFPIVQDEDIHLFREILVDKFGEEMIKIAELYDLYMAFVFIKDTKKDDQQTYQKSLKTLLKYKQ